MPRSNSVELSSLARRLWNHDPSIWKDDPSIQQKISSRLGWLDVVEEMRAEVDSLQAFGSEVRDQGYSHVVLLGMGGSSLAPDVFSHTFVPPPGYPELRVLDTTDSSAIQAVENEITPARSLFLVSSKSGTTTETLSLYRYFWERVAAGKDQQTGENFVAITDPGTPLAEEGRARGFRRVFENRPDIGGRYSVLSYFGLVPAALIGVDLPRLLDSALRMAAECRNDDPERNPGISLGSTMGQQALAGRDKLTLVLSPAISTFGYWAEQLIAESTGKEGVGIVPVEGEPLGGPDVYGNDRLFVHMSLQSLEDQQVEDDLEALQQAGHPVVHLRLSDTLDLGGEFLRWEIATAVAGAYLNINPFDEPNVQESKDNTSRLLKEYQEKGRLPEDQPDLSENPIALFGSQGASLQDALGQFFSSARENDYVALMAYIPHTEQTANSLRAIRVSIRNALKVATTVGYGPRFLHSTGQLHKGGAPNGVFVQITAEDLADLDIPGAEYDFNTLKRAQALGDFQALKQHGLRAISLRLTGDTDAGLSALQSQIESALSTTSTSSKQL